MYNDTINDVDFVTFYFPSKRRKQFKFLLNIAYKADTYELFIEYINKKKLKMKHIIIRILNYFKELSTR